MSLSHAINAARSGLQVSGLRADIVANNVANATTPGYVRRSALLSETLAGPNSVGVHSDGIARASSDGLTAQRQSLSSDRAQASVMASTWQSISTRVGDTAEGSGIFGMMSDLASTLKAAETSPESKTNANAVIDAARALASEFNALADMAANQRAEADREIADGVNVVNQALRQVEELNTRLSSMDRASSGAAALMDERQRVIDTISEYMPVETVPRDFGGVDVVTKEGVYLVAGTARQIEFTPSNSFGPNQTVDSGALSGLSVDGLNLTPGATEYSAVSSGMFGALFTLRDNDLPDFTAQLDTLAGDLMGRLSDGAVDPTKPPGDPGLFVDTAPTGGPGLAGRITVNAAIDPAKGGEIWRLRDGVGAVAEGPPGNGQILSAMVDALTSARSISSSGFQGSFTSSELAATFASRTGQSRISNEAVLSSTSSQHAAALQAEQAQTGVDVDTQMQDLLLIEQSYAANARVIEVAGQMINRLMEL